MYDGDSLDCGNYFSDVFYFNTGIWWHCDNSNITGISDFPEGDYTRKSRKLTTKQVKLFQDLNTYCLYFISEKKI